MKQEVRNVGKFSALTPSSGSNYLLYITLTLLYNIVVLKVLILSILLYIGLYYC